MYDASLIASYVIDWCQRNNKSITNLRLQKLLYFLQGEYCLIRDDRLLKDDFYAWQLGPVIPKIYEEYSVFSSYDISVVSENEFDNIYISDKVLINMILNAYSNLSTWELVEKSHHEDPWKYTVDVFGENSIIPFELIRKYYFGGVTEGA